MIELHSAERKVALSSSIAFAQPRLKIHTMDKSGIAMSTEDALATRVIVTSIAGGVVVFVAIMLIKSITSGGKPVVWGILRIAAGLVGMLLAYLLGRGSIGSWGAWLGFVGVLALLLSSLLFRSSYNQPGHRNDSNP
jgi:hypothetical protein